MKVLKFAAMVLAAVAAAPVQTSAAEDVPVPRTQLVPAGDFIFGSDRSEREKGYKLDEAAYGHSRTRTGRWYENERKRQTGYTDAYFISKTPITNEQYQAFIKDTGHPAPDVDKTTWKGYGLIHPYSRTRRHAWEGGVPPKGRADHPVVMVSVNDAKAYAEWLSAKTGSKWRLPTEDEWEKAARGSDGRLFPWGNSFDAGKANTHDGGPFDTVPVGSFPEGKSPFGLLDAAGQVFEWTGTPWRGGRHTVKGGSWDDSGCGVCRSSARHGRPDDIKHILVGFRLVKEL